MTSTLRTHTHSAAAGAAAAGPGEPISRSEPPGRAEAPHTLLPPAAAEAPPGPTGHMRPAAPGPNAAPRTRIPPPRRWPGPHLPLRHGSAQPGPARSSSAQSARHSPARPLRPLGGSRSLTGGTQRRPRPLSPYSQSPPRVASWPRPASRRAQSPRGPCPGSAPPAQPRPAGFPRSGRGLLGRTPRPAASLGAVALRLRAPPREAGLGAPAGPLTTVRHVGGGSRRSRAPLRPSVPSNRGRQAC